jgi:hypothetical protein
VLVSDEHLSGTAPVEVAMNMALWEPGQPVESRRVYIPRGAPAELLAAAIKAVWASREDTIATGAGPPQLAWPEYAHEEATGVWS